MRLLTSSRAWSKGGTPGPDSAAEYTSFNNFIKEIVVEGIQVELVIWDNTGMDGYEKLRRLSYEDVHVVLLCFDISDQDSFDNLRHLWNVEADTYLKKVPKILVGCKKELQNDVATLRSLRESGHRPISTKKAEAFALEINALAYLETSAVQKSGLDELFDYAARAALTRGPSKGKKGIRRFLSRSEMKFKS
ncbi:GTP-binding protein rho3 precursor [Trematosphaeria pertusa]|uniref:GTP-binding protein rho3 n=1 Tax=Trematosphaeria pertusa TaxID=390896 RepID=A0A6A6I160_9PLEO|nr:GTP-binding protein rho3 precursor [Trematosphaeria pertusa]KAF2243748.1 GTP-binding protein rho3 precursor [Trematosphaeria pertusa]